MELAPLRNALVGLPGVSGLSVEQRKRLTIAVELVANPSIIFLDEPTSGAPVADAGIGFRVFRGLLGLWPTRTSSSWTSPPRARLRQMLALCVV